MTNYSVPVLNPESGFINYVEKVKKIPSLSAEEEYKLAKKYVEEKDIYAAQELVTSHLKLVVRIAASFRGYGLPPVELVSEGNLGLMQAVKKFEPEKGFRLSTYAMWWIKAAIQEYILKSWSLVKIGTTAAQKKLFFNLGKIKRRIENYEQRRITSDDYVTVAKELNVKVSDVREMDQRMNPDSSLDDPIGHENDNYAMIDVIPSNSESPELQLLVGDDYKSKKNKFDNAFIQLNEREQYIITNRKLKESPLTLEELSKKYNISKERVRQIEANALKKLQNLVVS